MKTQIQLFYESQRYVARGNEHFMDLVRNDDITNGELKKLIEMNPDLWGRFSRFIGKLRD